MSPTVLAPHAPLPYREALIDRIAADQFRPRYNTVTSKSPMDQSPQVVWERLKSWLPGLVKGLVPGYGPLARLEFFRDLEHDALGVALFDSREHLVVHIVPAQLGRNCNGAKLSQAIMSVAGVPAAIIDELNQVALGGPGCNTGWLPYRLIVSRQHHETVNGEDRAYPSGTVNDHWVWWRAIA